VDAAPKAADAGTSTASRPTATVAASKALIRDSVIAPSFPPVLTDRCQLLRPGVGGPATIGPTLRVVALSTQWSKGTMPGRRQSGPPLEERSHIEVVRG